MQPKISVVFPVGNREAYLSEAIESVLAQSFGDFEFLIIEDGVQSPVESLIRSYRDERIRIITFPMNLGISTARNAGLNVASAPYIALMDSDDVALPERFGRQYAWMESHPELTVCGSNAIKLFSDGQRFPMRYPESDGQIKSRLFFVDGAILNPTSMFRTEFVRTNGVQYDANYPRDQDHRFFVEMMRKGAQFYGLQEELLLYRRHKGNATSSRDGVDEEKTTIREILVPLFFPELTGEEGRIMLKGCCEKVRMTMIEACFCVVVMNKALRESRVAMGEEREELRKIINSYRTRLIKSLEQTHSG
jgi:glycosyltransferase involved in cell wall biosynthesis